MPYQSLTPNDMTVIDLAGQQVAGIHPASSETPLHAHLYSVFESIHAVVHTHSLYATAFSVVRKPIPLVSLEDWASIPSTCPWRNMPCLALPTWQSVPSWLSAATRVCRPFCCPITGLVTIGAALEDAFSLAINVEREAQILAIASSLGTPVQLTAAQLSQINATYAAMHAKTA